MILQRHASLERSKASSFCRNFNISTLAIGSSYDRRIRLFMSLVRELSCDSIRPVAEFDDGHGGVLLCRFKRFESSEIELVR